MRRGRRLVGSDNHGREALALLAALQGEFRLALRFASRASVDSVQFLDALRFAS